MKPDINSPDFQAIWIKNLVKSKYHLLNLTAVCWLFNTEFIGNKVQDFISVNVGHLMLVIQLAREEVSPALFGVFFHLNFCLHQKSFHDCNEAL